MFALIQYLLFRFVLNSRRGHLTILINDIPQGGCLTGLKNTVYPAVCFYGSNRAVRFVLLLVAVVEVALGKSYFYLDHFKRISDFFTLWFIITLD